MDSINMFIIVVQKKKWRVGGDLDSRAAQE